MTARDYFPMGVAICRDHRGSTCFAWTKKLPPKDPSIGEANAAP